MKTEIEVLNLVFELNSHTMDDGHTGLLIFESSGFSSAVTMYGQTVWDDKEGTPWNEEGTERMELRQFFLERILGIKEQLIADCDLMRKGCLP